MLSGGVCGPRSYKVWEDAPESLSAGCMCLSRHGFVPSLGAFMAPSLPGLASRWSKCKLCLMLR